MRHPLKPFALGEVFVAAFIVAGIVFYPHAAIAAPTDTQANTNALNADPKNLSARLALIQANIDSGNYGQAENLGDAGVKLLPNNASLWAARGAAYYNDGIFQRTNGNDGLSALKAAAESYDQAMKFDANATGPSVAASAYAQYGLALWQVQQYSQCLAYAQKATSANPKAWEYSMLQGDCESGLQDYKASIADYKIAQQGDKGNNPELSARLLSVLGTAQLSAGEQSAGMESLKQAESIDPRMPIAYRALATYYISKNPPDLNAAVAPLLQLADLQPNDPQVQVNLGDIFLRQGNFDQANGAFAKALQINPHNSDAQFGFAEIAAAQGHIASIDSPLQKAVALNPDEGAFYNATIAQLLLAPDVSSGSLQRYESGLDQHYMSTSDRGGYAQKYADAATKANPNDGTGWYELGIAYAQEGRKDMAGAALRKAFTIFSSRACVDVYFVGRSDASSCMEYQKRMLYQTNDAYIQLNGKDATLMGSGGIGGGTGKDITTNGDMPH